MSLVAVDRVAPKSFDGRRVQIEETEHRSHVLLTFSRRHFLICTIRTARRRLLSRFAKVWQGFIKAVRSTVDEAKAAEPGQSSSPAFLRRLCTKSSGRLSAEMPNAAGTIRPVNQETQMAARARARFAANTIYKLENAQRFVA